jgi:hypothetical protein
VRNGSIKIVVPFVSSIQVACPSQVSLRLMQK